MANPNIAQGTLNRLIASISIPSNTALNITAPYLGKDAIRIAFEGDTVVYIDTLTGAVTSPSPYLMVTVTAHLLTAQPLAQAYKAQIELSALVGNIVVRPDTVTMQPWPITNASIMSPRELAFDGLNPDYAVMLKGYYSVNGALWG